MSKPISDYTVDELSAKIEATKAERERAANALKRYEDELERRRTLGVPLEDKTLADWFDSYTFGFASEESRSVFDGRLKDYVKVLQKLAKGEPIDIRFLVPLMKKGWVAMDKDGVWIWYENKPHKGSESWCPKGGSIIMELYTFNLKPADDWQNSLMECGI